MAHVRAKLNNVIAIEADQATKAIIENNEAKKYAKMRNVITSDSSILLDKLNLRFN
jgi:precorrin-6B methylase 2